MHQIPAKCGNCGYLFPSGYGFDPGDTGVEASMSVGEDAPVNTPCPMCGKRRGRVLSGEFEFVKDAMRFLQGPETTVHDLERLAEFLRGSQQVEATPDEILARAGDEAPEVVSLVESVLGNRPARMELAAWMTFVATIIVPILIAYFGGDTEQPEPSRVIYNTNNYNITVQAPPEAGPSKVGRNDPCPCGSGKKFKKCHGDPMKAKNP